MRAHEFITERRHTDAELYQMGWDGNENDRDMLDDEIPNGRASTRFSAIDAIYDILGYERVFVDYEIDDATEEDMARGAVVVNTNHGGARDKFGGGQFFQHGDTWEEGLEINLGFDADSHDARHVAISVHEACHARLALGSRGTLYGNEKLANKLAERWLRAHLTGMPLYVALEVVTNSRIHYRHEEL